jgi:hypothetical protein
MGPEKKRVNLARPLSGKSKPSALGRMNKSTCLTYKCLHDKHFIVTRFYNCYNNLLRFALLLYDNFLDRNYKIKHELSSSQTQINFMPRLMRILSWHPLCCTFQKEGSTVEVA